MPEELEGNIQNSDKDSIGVWCRDRAATKSQEKRLEVNEMRMLRWMCGVTKTDKITNDYV